ncbi:DUF3828 domain-containing protein [Leminorella grimontii]|uniref:DUF3828 domain-containing protein n=1 Tax=Leminorella grimontii TaxID=82981 RepID=UPI00041EF4DE|nr:DUF3828 domain-containing protein [Leminorella grimontii]KFC96763.1 hypothetical protein GLGR_0762 [Leminorella grimontii ATCC 33999 = DSM 5078]VFS57455.1 Protein of uncharacterised function (DUF3828) [Leminorella grimontii]
MKLHFSAFISRLFFAGAFWLFTTSAQSSPALPPAQIVQNFYSWYLYDGETVFKPENRSTLDGLLAPSLIEQQQKSLDKPHQSTDIDYFLKVGYWDDSWNRVDVKSETIDGDSALLTVEIGFQGVSTPIETLAVTLRQQEQRWKISDVALIGAKDPCSTENDTRPEKTVKQSPQEAAEAFYRWYMSMELAEKEAEGGEDILNYVTANFWDQLYRIQYLGDDEGNYFTKSQDVLDDWQHVKSAPINQTPEKAQVDITLGGVEYPAKRLKVTLVPYKEMWKVCKIESKETN